MFLVDTRAGTHRRRRGDQAAPSSTRASLPRMARRAPGQARAICRTRRRCRSRITTTVLQRQQAFGYTFEDLRILMAPMARDGMEPSARWATTRRWPCSRTGRSCSTTTSSSSSPRSPTRRSTPSARRSSPRRSRPSAPRATCSSRSRRRATRSARVADPAQRRAGEAASRRPRAGFKSVTLPILFAGATAAAGLRAALDELCATRRRGHRRGRQHHDPVRPRRRRGSTRRSRRCWPSPRLHHHLIREGTRTARRPRARDPASRARSTTSRCCIGYGAGAINPYLAFETLDDMIRQGHAGRASTHEQAVQELHQGRRQGLVKVISKMGISTIQSYRGAQIFEAVGLNRDVDRQVLHLDRLAHRGVGLDVIAAGSTLRASRARLRPSAPRTTRARRRRPVPVAQGRRGPSVQPADRFTSCSTPCRANDYELFKEYSQLIDDQAAKLLHAARPARASSRTDAACRSTRSSRSKRS